MPTVAVSPFCFFVPRLVFSMTPFVPPSTEMYSLLLATLRHPLPGHEGSASLALVMKAIVIGLPLDPLPLVSIGSVIVPHSSTVAPGAIWPALEPQSPAEFSHASEWAFEQPPSPLWLPEPACET